NTTNTQTEVFGLSIVKHKGMDVTKEFEAVQESFTERLSKQNETTDRKVGLKKLKKKHNIERKTQKRNRQNEEMILVEMEIKTNTEADTTMTSSLIDMEGTEQQGTSTNIEDQQEPEQSLTDQEQQMKIDLQTTQIN
ncbi:37550_t:CDS:1, partial [Gigaspora margarita]